MDEAKLKPLKNKGGVQANNMRNIMQIAVQGIKIADNYSQTCASDSSRAGATWGVDLCYGHTYCLVIHLSEITSNLQC